MTKINKGFKRIQSADSDDRIPRVNIIAIHPTRFDEVRSPKGLFEYQLPNLLIFQHNFKM